MAGVVIASDRIIAASQNGSSHVEVVEYSERKEIPAKLREALHALADRTPVVIAVPCERSSVFEQHFAPRLTPSQRVKIITNNVAPERYDVEMRSSLGVTMQSTAKDSALVGIVPREVIEDYIDIAKASRARLAGLEWEAFAWQRLFRGTATRPASVPADAVIVGNPLGATAIVFDDPVPHVRVFEMTPTDWGEALSSFFSEVASATAMRVDPRRIALVGDFSEATIDYLASYFHSAEILPISTTASQDPFAPLALALDDQVRFDFRTALSRERLGALFQRERGVILSVVIACALSLAVGLGYSWVLSQREMYWARMVSLHNATFQSLDAQRRADDLKIGGAFGDLTPYLGRIDEARSSGTVLAAQMQRIGNTVGPHTNLTALTQRETDAVDLTLETTDYPEALRFFDQLPDAHATFERPDIEYPDNITKFTVPAPQGIAPTAVRATPGGQS